MFRINVKQFKWGFHDVTVMKRSIHRKNSYYDLLGITPRATQADIKKAFYKLSMQCHPDKTTGDSSKFREISAAYEVLGNSKLRRMYDKGYLPVGASTSTYEDIKENYPDEPDPLRRQGFEWKRPNWDPPEGTPPPSGKTSSYNFDEWTKMHYSDTFSRSRTRIDQFQWIQFRRRKRQEVEDLQKARLIRFLMVITVFMAMYHANAALLDWDRIPKPKRD